VTPLDQARLRVARGLESGEWDGLASRALSSAWSTIASRTLARPLVCPANGRVVAVGGATLGGSGKTPLAIACARAIARGGERVAFVAHGYRGTVGAPRVVRVDDEVAVVGDEALVAARALRGIATVVVAQKRQAALDLAATLADVLVIDGVLQTSPRRASLALLALDASSPWGSGHLPPRGDLRALRGDLLAVCDRSVLLCDALVPLPGVGDHVARLASAGARVSDRLIAWPELASLRVGLFVALARPSRILQALARRGVIPAAVVASPDHTRPAPGALAAAEVDLWLASPKCATHLEAQRIPHATLDYDVILDESLVEVLTARPSGPVPG
jgi:tetraacyldisaccharide 4'-kinase